LLLYVYTNEQVAYQQSHLLSGIVKADAVPVARIPLTVVQGAYLRVFTQENLKRQASRGDTQPSADTTAAAAELPIWLDTDNEHKIQSATTFVFATYNHLVNT